MSRFRPGFFCLYQHLSPKSGIRNRYVGYCQPVFTWGDLPALFVITKSLNLNNVNLNLKIAVLAAGIVSMICMGCSKSTNNDIPGQKVLIVSASGDINFRLEEFRQLLGAQLNTAPGAVGGRREITWDGVPDDLVGKRLPDDFFNPTEPGSNPANQRGLIYTAPGSFQVSNSNFSETNPVAASQFSSFSGNKTFSNVGSNLWDVEFQVAGAASRASVRGFGIVFSDVDVAQSSSLEFFNEDKSLGKFFVPVRASGSSFSFLGVYFKEETVTRIRVSHQGKLTDGQPDVTDGGPADLVVMDNFLYSEPVQK